MIFDGMDRAMSQGPWAVMPFMRRDVSQMPHVRREKAGKRVEMQPHKLCRTFTWWW